MIALGLVVALSGGAALAGGVTPQMIDAAWNAKKFSEVVRLLDSLPPPVSINRKLAMAEAAFNAMDRARASALLDEVRSRGGLDEEQNSRVERLAIRLGRESQRGLVIKVGDSRYALSDDSGTQSKDLAKVAAVKALQACYEKKGSTPCEPVGSLGPID
jgi:hypothetical protein